MRNETINQIEWVRTENNKLWMEILRIAMDNAPIATKKVLAKIRKNDQQISELMGMLAHGD